MRYLLFWYKKIWMGAVDMAVFRVEKTRDYTVISNDHIKNARLSLRAKGLMSLMLSLPESWNYTMNGLARISLEGVDAIRKALQELEAEGYVVRSRIRNAKGQLTDTEYVIYEKPVHNTPEPDEPTQERSKQEQPMQAEPMQDSPVQEKPMLENPILEKPVLENPTQLNIYNNKIYNKLNTKLSSTNLSNPIPSNPVDRNGSDGIAMREHYRSVIQENIGYEVLCERESKERLDEIVELMLDTVCTARKTIRIAGDDYPADVVRSRLLKIGSTHIEYIFDCLKNNTTRVRNIRQYLLTALFNALSTMDNYYAMRVNHDLYGT